MKQAVPLADNCLIRMIEKKKEIKEIKKEEE